MTADAEPPPRISLPLAVITAVCVASSRLVKLPSPLKFCVTGPSFTLTVAVNSSPVNDVSVAPGMQGAIDSTSSRVFQAVSISAGTMNEFCRSIDPP